ncbi:ParB/RepB/Spo0J family partition protein [Streptomyces virginiae]|uniref:ParB/RepB/Spo0J family partition protein n=3 Tax=Streptomyces TaxID=1883 RepID=UPI0035D7372A
MSKSDLLGTGAAFATARRSGGRSERGRAKAIAQGDLPEYELIRLPLGQVSPTPLNPRRNFGTDEEKTRFGEELRESQLAACVVVSRSAYLKLWSDHEVKIGDADHVLLNGERRYRSAQHVGLDTLDFVVRDDLAASREEFIHHLLAENLDREDFDVIERARGVQRLVDICAEDKEHGAKSRAAERLGKSPGWVTQQLALLQLPEEIQQLLSSGDLPERDARIIVRAAKESPELSPSALLELLNQSKTQQAEWKAEQKEIIESHRAAQAAGPFTAVKSPSAALPSAPPPAPHEPEATGLAEGPFTAVKSAPAALPSAPPPAPHEPEATGLAEGPFTAVKSAPAALPSAPPPAPHEPEATGLPEQRVMQTPTTQPKTVLSPASADPSSSRQTASNAGDAPWEDGNAVMDLALAMLSPEQRTCFLHRYIQRSGSTEALVADLARDLPESGRHKLADILAAVADSLRSL